MIADGFENQVYETKFEITCPTCAAETATDVMNVLRGAELSDRYAESAERDYVQSQVGKIMCSGCGAELMIYFGHGEVQPARYRFVQFAVELDTEA